MLRRALTALTLALVLAGCGGAAGGDAGGGDAGGGGAGTATLWVTRDRGSEVLLDVEVPAGLTVLQALDREAEIETRYGGRYVQAIDGLAGSLAEQRDWFYFVNGIEPDVGAAEVRLEAGDVAWWDFRSWEREAEARVVVGAFPMPLTRGFDGRGRPLEVRAPAGLGQEAAALEESLGAGAGEGEPNVFELVVEEGAEGATLRATRDAANDSPVTVRLAGSEQAVRAAAAALAADPSLVRFRYVARFDEAGALVP